MNHPIALPALAQIHPASPQVVNLLNLNIPIAPGAPVNLNEAEDAERASTVLRSIQRMHM